MPHRVLILTVLALVRAAAVQHTSDCPAPIPILETRHDLGRLAESEAFLRGAELGVLHGAFSKQTLKHQENYADDANLKDEAHEAHYHVTLKNTEPWADKIRVCRNYTTVCAKRIDDGYLDYVYVDARHDRKGVLVDLEAWWPKIRAGGILAGHDFTTQELWGSGPGEHQNWTINYDGSIDVSGRVVRGAVEDFAKRKNRQIQLTYKDGNLPSWAIRK